MHPTGCVDVDSERAPVDQRDAEVDQRQQRGREQTGSLDGRRELLRRLQDRRAMREDLRGIEDGAEEFPLLREDLLEGRIAAVVFDLFHSGHITISYRERAGIAGLIPAAP